ncbi:MAG: transposase, partial [Acidobacteria bacterium]|nr:transposase [Acidobacteriota bacterium]
SAARWCPRVLGLVMAELIVTGLVAPGAPITVAIDDTVFRRRGKKVDAAGWFHDGAAAGQVKRGYGTNWVVAAILVTLPFLSRPVALPVLATLAVKGGALPARSGPGAGRRPRRTVPRPRDPRRGDANASRSSLSSSVTTHSLCKLQINNRQQVREATRWERDEDFSG